MRFRPSARRLISLAAVAIAGAAATLVVATPAFAHHVNTSGVASCDGTGQGWNVTWTVVSGGDWKPYYKILTVTTSQPGDPIAGELGSLPTSFKPVAQNFTGTQHFSNSVSSVYLTATSLFSTVNGPGGTTEGGGTEQHATASKPAGCNPVPTVDFKDNCDGTVTVTLGNLQGNAPATFKVTGASDQTVPAGQKVDVTVPGNVQIVVQSAGHDPWSHTWHAPTSPCPSPSASPSPSTSLPTTGSNTITPIAFGAWLLAAGVGLIALLFLIRRRRTVAGQ